MDYLLCHHEGKTPGFLLHFAFKRLLTPAIHQSLFGYPYKYLIVFANQVDHLMVDYLDNLVAFVSALCECSPPAVPNKMASPVMNIPLLSSVLSAATHLSSFVSADVIAMSGGPPHQHCRLRSSPGSSSSPPLLDLTVINALTTEVDSSSTIALRQNAHQHRPPWN